MKKVYVLTYRVNSYNEDIRVAGVFDSKDVCEAFKRNGDIVYESTYFDKDSGSQMGTLPWIINEPDWMRFRIAPWTIKESDWREVRTSDTSTSSDEKFKEAKE